MHWSRRVHKVTVWSRLFSPITWFAAVLTAPNCSRIKTAWISRLGNLCQTDVCLPRHLSLPQVFSQTKIATMSTRLLLLIVLGLSMVEGRVVSSRQTCNLPPSTRALRLGAQIPPFLSNLPAAGEEDGKNIFSFAIFTISFLASHFGH